ncbi:unnamed protein product [Parascedosporium putredinis]|uniref:Zn(2)-C6 fungal-type domain-containing protein n=1 Tax=Parascedosporium putredinis TaxID=1442378 RepID=A0A9P1H9E1_9PEZI|nr:unnamed protein product [Parascedosporium putredinis]CAI8001791.1 unnamed protein product [Parascedosporium putredinis]
MSAEHHEPALDGPSSSYPPLPTTASESSPATTTATTTTTTTHTNTTINNDNNNNNNNNNSSSSTDDANMELMASAAAAALAPEHPRPSEPDHPQEPAPQAVVGEKRRRDEAEPENSYDHHHHDPALLMAVAADARRAEGSATSKQKRHRLDEEQVRKIKCDALPEGCSACTTARVECFVTDRVSGRTERRGYLQEVERERERMVQYILDLERIITDATDMVVRPSAWTAGLPPAGELPVTPGFRPRQGALVDTTEAAENLA